jgi:hypothetical protein
VTGSFELDAREVLKDNGLWRAGPTSRAIGGGLRGRGYWYWCVSRHWAAPLLYYFVASCRQDVSPEIQPLVGP